MHPREITPNRINGCYLNPVDRLRPELTLNFVARFPMLNYNDADHARMRRAAVLLWRAGRL